MYKLLAKQMSTAVAPGDNKLNAIPQPQPLAGLKNNKGLVARLNINLSMHLHHNILKLFMLKDLGKR